MTKSSQETEERLQALLRGAFAGSPTPIEAMPKRKKASVDKAKIKPLDVSAASAKSDTRRKKNPA